MACRRAAVSARAPSPEARVSPPATHPPAMPPGPGPKPPQYPDYPSSTRPMQPPQQSNGPQPRPGYPGIPPPGQQGPPGAPRIMLPQPRAAGPYAATYPQQSHLGPDYYARPPSQQAATPSWADRPYPQVSGPPAAQPQPPSAMQQQQHPPTPSHQPPQPQQSQQLLQPASHLPAPNNSTITQPLASPQSSIKPTTPLAEASRGTETATPLPREQVARVEPLQPVESSVEASQPSPIESDDNRMKTRKRARETESAGAGFLSGRSKDGETGSGAKAGQKRRRGDYIPVRNDPRLENIPDDVEVVDFGMICARFERFCTLADRGSCFVGRNSVVYAADSGIACSRRDKTASIATNNIVSIVFDRSCRGSSGTVDYQGTSN